MAFPTPLPPAHKSRIVSVMDSSMISTLSTPVRSLRDRWAASSSGGQLVICIGATINPAAYFVDQIGRHWLPSVSILTTSIIVSSRGYSPHIFLKPRIDRRISARDVRKALLALPLTLEFLEF